MELPLLLLVLCFLPLLGLSLTVVHQDTEESFTINFGANTAGGSGAYAPGLLLFKPENSISTGSVTDQTSTGSPEGAIENDRLEAKQTEILPTRMLPKHDAAASRETADGNGGATTEVSVKGNKVANANHKSRVDEDKGETRYHDTVTLPAAESMEYYSKAKLHSTGTLKKRATTLPSLADLQHTTVQPELVPVLSLLNINLPSIASSASAAPRGGGISEVQSGPNSAIPENNERTLETTGDSLVGFSAAETGVATEFRESSHSTNAEELPSNNTLTPGTDSPATAITNEAAYTEPPTTLVPTIYKLGHSYQQTITNHALTGSSTVAGVTSVTESYVQISTLDSDVTRGTEEPVLRAPLLLSTPARGTWQGATASHDPGLEMFSTVASAGDLLQQRNKVEQNSMIEANGKVTLNSTKIDASRSTTDSANTTTSTTEGSSGSEAHIGSTLLVKVVSVTHQLEEPEQQGYGETTLETGYVRTSTPNQAGTITAVPPVEVTLLTSPTARVTTEMLDAVGTVTATALSRNMETVHSSVNPAAISQTESTTISIEAHARGSRTETSAPDGTTLTPLLKGVSTSSSTSQNRIGVTACTESTLRSTELGSIESASATTAQSGSTKDSGRPEGFLRQLTMEVDISSQRTDTINFTGVSNATRLAADHRDIPSTDSMVANDMELPTITNESPFRVLTDPPGAQTASTHSSASERLGAQEDIITDLSSAQPTIAIEHTQAMHKLLHSNEATRPTVLGVTGTTVIRQPVTTETSIRAAARTPILLTNDSNALLRTPGEGLVTTFPTEATVNATDQLLGMDSHPRSVHSSTTNVTFLGPSIRLSVSMVAQLEESSTLPAPTVMSTMAQPLKNLPSFDPTFTTVHMDKNATLLQSILTSTSVQQDKDVTPSLPSLASVVLQTNGGTTLPPPIRLPTAVQLNESSAPPPQIPASTSVQPDEDVTHFPRTSTLLPVDEELTLTPSTRPPTTAELDGDTALLPETPASTYVKDENVTYFRHLSTPLPVDEELTLASSTHAPTTVEFDGNTTLPPETPASTTASVQQDKNVTVPPSILTSTITQIDKDVAPLLPVPMPTMTQLSENSTLSSPSLVSTPVHKNTTLPVPPPTSTATEVDESSTLLLLISTSTRVNPNENSTLSSLLPTSTIAQLNESSILHAPPQPSTATPNCVPLEPPRSPSHEFRLVFETSTDFSWEQIEVLERRIQYFLNDTPCSKNFARTAFALGPPHVLSWTNPLVNSTWCDQAAVDTIFHSMMDPSTTVPTKVMTSTFLPEFHVISVQLQLRGACLQKNASSLLAIAGAVVGIVLATALLAGLLTLLWKMLRLTPRSRKLEVTPPPLEDSFDLKQRRPMLLPGEARDPGEGRAPAGGSTPHKTPRAKPNPPFVVDTDFCYINPNFLEAVKPSPPPPPPYRRPLDRRVRSLEAVLPARPPHATLGNRSLGGEVTAEQEELNCTSSSSGVESDVQHSGGGK